MASALRGLLDGAPAGSDVQLAYVRAFAGVATNDEDLALLAGLLDGSAALEGLAVDTDLRWALLSRLVSRGADGPGGFGAERIEKELDRDATDAGQRNAETCRAAIPTAEAKQAAWDTMVSGEPTLATFRAILSGFVDLDQAALTEPYREQYFAVVGDIWRDWSSAMAQDFAGGIYSAAAISAETVRATDDYIAAANPPDGLRRVLTEGRDDVLRALRCQAKDGQAKDGQAKDEQAKDEQA
jgi:aminopeptidase N